MVRPTKRVQKRVARELRQAKTTADREEVLAAVLAETKSHPTPVNKTPGAIIGDTKVSWTWADMIKRFPIKSFIPDETVLLTWNGVPVQCYNGIEMHVPEPFYTLYNRHRDEQRKHTDDLRFLGIDVQKGVGALA